jgi:hypothetical protein
MSSIPIALLDANVLVPHWSRIILRALMVKQPPRFVGVWSSAIVAETWRILTVRHIGRGGSASALSRDAHEMWVKLDPVLRIAEVSHRPLDAPPSPLRDRNDEHLWIAALNAGAQYVVSHNTRHFPPAVAVEASTGTRVAQTIRHLAHGIEFLTAIEFIEDVLGEDAAALYDQPLPSGIVRSRRSG